jgi:hypothetical protein
LYSCLQEKPELLQKYKQSHLESYMEDNQRVAFCPSVPWCGRAVEVRSGSSSFSGMHHSISIQGVWFAGETCRNGLQEQLA